MSEKWNRYLDNGGYGIYTFMVWTFIAIFIGALVGVVGIAFHLLLEKATMIRMTYPHLILCLPFGGLCIVWLYHVLHMENDKGTNLILSAVRANEKVSFKLAPLIFCSTVITHFFGGSAGREGAALQLGGSIASSIGRYIHLDEKDERIMTMCGMSAGFAALFGTPIAAVVFSMEVITVGVMHYSAMVPCVVAALTASGLSVLCGISPTAYSVSFMPELTASGVGSVLLLGILCAGVSIVFCLAMEWIGKIYRSKIKNPYLRIFVGGCVVVLLTYFVGTRDYNGAGMDVIARAIAGEAQAEAFLWKILLTALTLGAGFKGGEIVPSFFVGATFGCVLGPWIDLPASFAAALGLAGVFCGVTNCPLASVILCVELFGAKGLGYYALVCAVSYMLSGYFGLYSAQKIMYSKMQPEFINKDVE